MKSGNFFSITIQGVADRLSALGGLLLTMGHEHSDGLDKHEIAAVGVWVADMHQELDEWNSDEGAMRSIVDQGNFEQIIDQLCLEAHRTDRMNQLQSAFLSAMKKIDVKKDVESGKEQGQEVPR